MPLKPNSMSGTLHIFLSFNTPDSGTAADLQKQLTLVFQPKTIVFWNRDDLPPEDYRVKAKAFLEKTDLFIAVLSMDFEIGQHVHWEVTTAVEIQKSRPSLQILAAQARVAAIPFSLAAFDTALPPGEAIENNKDYRDRQLKRVADKARLMVAAAPRTNDLPEFSIDLPLTIEDVRERLQAQTDRINHAPLLTILKRMVENVTTKRVILDVEEKFKQLRELTRLSKITFAELEEKATPAQIDLQHFITHLQEDALVHNWKQVFIRDYFHFVTSSREASTIPPFFVPVDDVAIPETLNLPVGPREQESLEQIGLLSFEQKSDFRRSLLLAKDALAVNNFSAAYAHCDHARTRIDPQSAQLYEYLLITFVQQEKPLRILQEAVNGNERLLNYVLLFAGRYRDYQQQNKCPSSTGPHNLAIASEALSDAALRMYHGIPNDAVRHTGKHADSVPESRRALRIILDSTLKVGRLVSPSEELLEAAVIESCGGGKCHWLKRVDVVKGHFQFMPDGHFDLLGEIQELLDLLESMEANESGKIVKQSGLLREDLFFSLLAKRQGLYQQIQEDKKRLRPFTDQRESVIRFVYACLMGAEVFGDKDQRGRDLSFYRLALEYLLPGLLVAPDQSAQIPLRWFDLDTNGAVTAHPDCAAYEFDVQAIVEKIIRDHAGQAGWMQVQPNIKESVYLLFTADIEVEYEEVKKGLQWTDFRRMDEQEARRRLISCIRRWVIAYRAYPERGATFLHKCLHELSGSGFMLWFTHDPDNFQSHPDSIELGLDTRAALKTIYDIAAPGQLENEEMLRKSIADNLFDKHILADYNKIKPGKEAQRSDAVRLLREAMSNFRLYPDLRYLDFIFRELTEEVKFCWIDITKEGMEASFTRDFNPLQIIRELNEIQPDRYGLLQVRERISIRRHANQIERYFLEISEFKHENRRPEREVAIDILRNIKGIYKYLPKEEFLELPLRELNGRGRIRWNALLFGFFPLKENHFENKFLGFEYKFERFDFRRLLDNQYEEMQRVLRETGDLK